MALSVLFLSFPVIAQESKVQSGKGVLEYEDFERPVTCKACHLDIFRQWEQSMMSQAYTHHWDEVEYFKLAVPHAKNDPNVAEEVQEGCNGCHAPLAFLAGDVPPPHPGNSRADESVSCDICHTIVSVDHELPVNFNWSIDPGTRKRGPRTVGDAIQSPHHDMVFSDFHRTTEFCGSCHNEENPYGMMVKATQIELLAGPYGEEGVRCNDCHMTNAPGTSAKMGNKHADVRQHLFHGGHDPGKVRGVVELRIHPDIREAEPGDVVQFQVALFNQKTGHKFPTGSVEDRILWLHVEATDKAGNVYHLPVDPKGFDGEEMTISADVLAYQDMAIPLGDPGFKGVQRDGVPFGDRIFRMPYLDSEGRMTIMQWNTTSFGVDYRLGPRETKLETFTFELPFEVEPGEMTITATLNYALLVKPVADFLGAPEEGETMVVNTHSTTINVLD